jgi:amino acid transporter
VAVIVVGLYWIIVSWGFSISVPPANVVNLMKEGFTPITPIARQYWGSWNILITISAMTSITGIYIAQTAATSRALYAMGREGALPKWFSGLNAHYRVPWNAMTLGIVLTTAVTLILGAVLGLANQYSWTGTMTSFLGLLTYFAVNVVNVVFFWRFRRDKFNWFLNGVVPAIGIIVVLYILYNSYLVSLWMAGWAYGQSVQLAVVLWLLLGIGWTLWQRSRNPALFRKKVEVFEGSSEQAGTDGAIAS